MNETLVIEQIPIPGKHLLKWKGDLIKFSLTLSHEIKGQAFVRTNIGHASITRNEIIRYVHLNDMPLSRDWFDIPMNPVNNKQFQLTLGLSEVGHFKAKCLFIPENESHVIWPDGENTIINVDPAFTCCGNIIYNAFVRQFGPNINGKLTPNTNEKQWIQQLDQNGYTVIPPSGTFHDVIRYLDFIIGDLGCRIILFLPIHPTPTTYGRMGRFGSPYAALSFTDVDPALANFVPHATPLEQFIELVDAIHQKNALVFMDIAINHTGWAANLHERHPDWLAREPDGTIEMPGAWGVTWADLTRLDYSKTKLWQYMASVFLTWCKRGVDGFRCDAGYMIPVKAWQYIIARVREQYPDTIFLLEGLGGPVDVTKTLLNTANLNWAYSELFQNYDRSQIEPYLSDANQTSAGDGIMIHFCETHDNNRLASTSVVFSKIRSALCALCSHQGGFGFANGVEWFATEKIDVHGAPSLNWGAEINQVAFLNRLHLILKNHPAFFNSVTQSFVPYGDHNCIALLRHHIPTKKMLLILINLNANDPVDIMWQTHEPLFDQNALFDLISGQKISVQKTPDYFFCPLQPGESYCLSPYESDIQWLDEIYQSYQNDPYAVPEQIKKQQYRSKVLEIREIYKKTTHLTEDLLNSDSEALYLDPIAFCQSMNPFSQETRVVKWQWPEDQHRMVMVPPDHFVCIVTPNPFHVQLIDHSRTVFTEKSLFSHYVGNFALIPPIKAPKCLYEYNFQFSLFLPNETIHTQAKLLYIDASYPFSITTHLPEKMCKDNSLIFLSTNDRGGMQRAHIAWAELTSRYDALLAANLNPSFPEDRWIMFTRCRAWVTYQGFYQEINRACLTSFEMKDHNIGIWHFHIPTGKGEHIYLSIQSELIEQQNIARIMFYRHAANTNKNELNDNNPVTLIIRPDIEDRNFHEPTKAYAGPEEQWPNCFSCDPQTVLFTPHPDRTLKMEISQGHFVWQPEWYYSVYRSFDAERGHDPDSDLFSPGYFNIQLNGTTTIELIASIIGETEQSSKIDSFNQAAPIQKKEIHEIDFVQALKNAMNAFIVKRGDLRTVIAGYPWFLDWGRDTFIFLRGLIASGDCETSHAIIKQFAGFESHGTLPNMIRGTDAANRDTSDAPLWFFVVCSELIQKEQSTQILDETIQGRKIRDILVSIGSFCIKGTPNGIYMDDETGLLYSPAHFTWMDTNYPAGTPRKGYPIEIQSLWHYALTFLSHHDQNRTYPWQDISKRVRASIQSLFWLENERYLSDCLHANYGTSAKDAIADDALRPNQLLAITLSAIDIQDMIQKILTACESLLVPGAIRSLADKPLKRYALPIFHNGQCINNPHHPYWGTYQGDEDTQRKPGYHNGTAWTWIFPSFCEAWLNHYGKASIPTVKAWLLSSLTLINQGCIGHVPEIVDGNFPHTPRGCDAQAWGVSELYRVWQILHSFT